MNMQLIQLRHAIQALYWPQNSATQPEADKWLQSFRNSPGAWDVCLALLRQPDLQDVEQEFAAHTLKLACQKYQERQLRGGVRYSVTHMPRHEASQLPLMRRAHPYRIMGSEVLEPATIPRILQELTTLYLSAAYQQNWKVGSQLSWAIVVLVVRSPAWPVSTLLRDLHTLFSSANLRPSLPPMPPSISLVCTLYAATLLPEVCSSRFTSVHAARRQEVLSFLRTSPSILELLHGACCLGGSNMDSQVLDLCWKLISSWCTDLNCIPVGLEHNTNIIELLYSCAVGQGPAADSATECLAALFSVCGPPSSGKSAGAAGGGRRSHPHPPAASSSASNTGILSSGAYNMAAVQPQWSVVLLGKLLARLPLLIEAMRSSLRAMPGGMGDMASDSSSVTGPVAERKVLLCGVLRSAGITVLPLMLVHTQKYQLSFNMVAEQLLSFLADADDAVSMTALEFWHEYLSTLLAVPQPQMPDTVSHHSLLLQHLAGGIMRRACLPENAASKATADARDLPEDVRNMRRELASCLRDICALMGAEAMLQLAGSAAEEQWNLMKASNDPHGWGLSNNWLHLESALYATNVILGKAPMVSSSLGGMQQLVQLATGCLAGHTKLAGTALTLLGGLGWWFEQHLEALPPVLEGIITLVQNQDDKLARNAATALRRICSNAQVAGWLATQQGEFTRALVAVYHKREEAIVNPGWSDEQSTEELLLEALCHMVCVSPALQTSSALLHHLLGPLLDKAGENLKTVQQHVAQASVATGGSSVVDINSSSFALLVQQAGGAFVGMARVLDNLNKNSTQQGGDKEERGAVSNTGSSPTSQLVDQLMPVLWEPLRMALMLSVHNNTLSQHLLPPCCHLLGACMLIARGGTQDMSSNMLKAVVHVIKQLPAQVLVLPSVHKLMQVCTEQLGVCVSVPTSTKRSGSSAGIKHIPALTPPPHPLTLLGAETWLPLLRLAQRCLLSGCEAIMEGSSREQWDSDRIVQLLDFAKVCGLCCPEVLHSQGLAGPLLQVTLIACTTFSADQCSAVLQWIPVLCAAAYAPSRGRSRSPDRGSISISVSHHSGSSRLSSPAGSVAPSSPFMPQEELALAAAASAAQRAVLSALAPGSTSIIGGMMQQPAGVALTSRVLGGLGGMIGQVEGVHKMGDPNLELMGQALEQGSGARLTLALLMAASGNMPPDAVLPIANCLHSMWMLLGTHRCYKWLEMAVRSQDTGPVPWAGLKLEARLAFVQDMLHPDNVADVSRLKRTLKAFCGGKKKGHR